MNRLNISQAQVVDITINDYDQIPLTLTYMDNSNPMAPAAINLNGWAFSFDFKLPGSQAVKKNYTLPVGGPATAYLTVTGTDNNVLNMEGMWQDIKDNQVAFNGTYRLIQQVTDNNGNIFVHIIYQISAQFD